MELMRGVQVRDRFGSGQDTDDVQRNKSEWVGPFKHSQWRERSRAGIKPSSLPWTVHVPPAMALAASPFVLFNIFLGYLHGSVG